jgi:hypothetical protein
MLVIEDGSVHATTSQDLEKHCNNLCYFPADNALPIRPSNVGGMYILLQLCSVNMVCGKKWIFRVENSVLRKIYTGNPMRDGAEKIGGDGADATSREICRMHVRAIDAVNGDDAANFSLLNVSDIDHAHIHGNNAYDRSDLAANEHAAFTTERSVNSIAVSSSQNRDARRPLSDKFSTVSDGAASGDVSNIDDAGAKAHHRLQRQAAFRLSELFRWVVPGVIAVQDDAGAHHIRPGFGAGGDGGAVCEMHDPRIDTKAAQLVQRQVKVFLLLAGLLALRRGCEGLR